MNFFRSRSETHQSVSAIDIFSEFYRWKGMQGMGADGFPYLLAFRGVNEYVRDAQPITIAELAKYAIDASSGIAIYQDSLSELDPIRRFTLGEVVQLARNRWQDADAVSLPKLKPKQKWNVGTPSAAIMPDVLRAAMAAYLRDRHCKDVPKVALVAIEASPGVLAVPFMLTPNLFVGDFASPAEWQAALRRFSWFIPPGFPMIQPPQHREAFDRWFLDVLPLVER